MTLQIPSNIDSLVRIYKSKEPVVDYITVVFTKPFFTEKGINYYSYLSMNDAPFWPQGFCQHGESMHTPIDRQNGRANYKHLGKKCKFSSLNEDCQRAILQDLEKE